MSDRILRLLFRVPRPIKRMLVPLHHNWYYARHWLYRLLTGYGNERFYAQCSEDWYLARLVRSRKGFFVDIGAYDGVTHSNSYWLERHGWTGLLVDASEDALEKAKKKRKAKTVHAAIVPKPRKTVTFTLAESPMLSGVGKGKGRHVTVPALTINQLLEKHAPDHIDLLTIDIEGMDYDVLASMDFSRFRPEIILAEENSTLETAKTKELLTSKGYRHHVRTLCNSIYVRQDG